jgi:hypothetical protein
MMGAASVVCAAAGAASCHGGIGAWSFGGSSPAQHADLVILNARVWTVDAGRPEAEAVAIVGDRIVAVGTRNEVEKWRGSDTHVIDARGRRLVPGFEDAHVHLMTGGAQLDNVDLKDASTPAEFARRIGDRARQTARGEWVLGGNWDEQAWPGAPLPTRELVDAVTPDTPVFVNRYDEHMSLANSVALRLAGVTARTPDPPGGLIVRDGKGNPTGILKDATEIALAKRLAEGAEPTEKETAFFHVSGAKGFADGSLGSTTAYFFEPYSDAPGSRGLLADEMQSLDAMRGRLVAIDRAGEQLCVHAIGDQAISMVLDLFSDVDRANGARDRRPRIEHSQHVAPKDFDRYARLGVIASVQPYHAIDDGQWADRRIGAERAKTTYAFRSFLDHKVRLAFGTDWPVAPLDPLQTVYAAVTRATLDGRHPAGWVPAQKVSVAEALEAYTLGAAYAEFQEREKGTIRAGRLADLVLLSDDPFRVAPAAIRDLKVQLTIAGGKIVYERR